MFASQTIQATLLLVFASYLVLTSLVMLWAGLGKSHWFWRAMAVVGWMALFVPPAMGDVYYLSGLLALVIVGPCWLLRAFQTWREAKRAGRGAWSDFRFGIKDLLLVVIPVGIAISLDGQVEFKLSPGYLLVVAVMFGGQALAAAWLVFGRRWIWLRLIAVALAMTGVFVLIWKCDFVTEPFEGFFFGFGPSYRFAGLVFPVGAEARPLMALIAFVPAVLLTTELVLVRAARHAQRRGWRVLGSLAAILGLVPLLFLFGGTYSHAIASIPPLDQNYPTPNAYVELMPLVDRWENMKIPDVDKVTSETIASFLKQNEADLRQARAAVQHPGTVVVRGETIFGPETLAGRNPLLAETIAFRHLILGLNMAAMNQQGSERAMIGRDLIRFGDRISNGGVLLHYLVGSIGTMFGAEHLHQSVKELDADTCRELGRELLELEQRAEPPEVIAQRDLHYTLLTSGWEVRVVWAVERLQNANIISSDRSVVIWHNNRKTAILGLLRTELALRRYYLDHHAWPTGLEALAPEYLEELPLDPFADQATFRYGLRDDGYELYSVGSNGRDDGGKLLDANGLPDRSGKDVDFNLETFERQRQHRAAEAAAAKAREAGPDAGQPPP